MDKDAKTRLLDKINLNLQYIAYHVKCTKSNNKAK